MRTNGLNWTNKDFLKYENYEIHKCDSKQKGNYLEHEVDGFPQSLF